MKKFILMGAFLVFILLIGCAKDVSQESSEEQTQQTTPTIPKNKQECIKTETGESLTLFEAIGIAMVSECNQGELQETSFCNENTGTWWIDLDTEKEGCSPACVVNVATQEAEINWRCTGALP